MALELMSILAKSVSADILLDRLLPYMVRVCPSVEQLLNAYYVRCLVRI